MEQGGGSEGDAVVAADVGGQAALLKKPFKHGKGVVFAGRGEGLEVFDQLLKRDRIRAITVKTVCLLDQDEAAVRARLEDTHHFSELFASWVLGRFDIHELWADLHSPKTRILRQQFLLSGN